MIKKLYIGLHVKYQLFLSNFIKVYISRQIFDKSSKSNFMKIRPVGAELFHADGRTDMTKLTAFRNFTKAPKNISKFNMCMNCDVVQSTDNKRWKMINYMQYYAARNFTLSCSSHRSK